MRNFFIVFAVIFSVHFTPAWAQNDQDVKEALQLTEQMLKDPDERNKEISKSPEKQAADQRVKDVAGSEQNEQAIYELAASVFGTLMSETGGDMDKMQQMLNEGMKNPEAFAKKWSPDEVAKLHKISEKVPQKSETSSTPQKSTTYRPPKPK